MPNSLHGKLDFLLKVPRTYKTTKERSPGEGGTGLPEEQQPWPTVAMTYKLHVTGFGCERIRKCPAFRKASGSAKKSATATSTGARLEGASDRVCDLSVADGCNSHQLKWF
jgi:hypothetical protein